MRSEAEIKANRPLELFTVNGKTYTVKILPITQADEWLERMDQISELERKIGLAGIDRTAAREARRKFNEGIYDAVFSYDPHSVNRSEIEPHVTPEQMVEAFYKLVEVTDPFEQVQLRTLESLRVRLQGLPSGILEKAMSAIQKPTA